MKNRTCVLSSIYSPDGVQKNHLNCYVYTGVHKRNQMNCLLTIKTISLWQFHKWTVSTSWYIKSLSESCLYELIHWKRNGTKNILEKYCECRIMKWYRWIDGFCNSICWYYCCIRWWIFGFWKYPSLILFCIDRYCWLYQHLDIWTFFPNLAFMSWFMVNEIWNKKTF